MMKHLFSALAIFLLLCDGVTQDPQNLDRFILTPPPPASPRINGPAIYGARPGSPFLYRIPCTGERPMEFNAEPLPEGVQMDPATGIISGSAGAPGTYRVRLTARNAHGEFSRDFNIVVGDRLALTPPMGWNSWYIHYDRISDKTMREAADQMIATGMADYGYQYVNIDDCWMRKLESDSPGLGGPRRDSDGVIIPNERFPDMTAMTEYIHS
jgi:alpha-galactosidase